MHSKQPKYIQLKVKLQEKILAGAYPEGMCFPPEAQLVSEYKVSRNTVRSALAELVSEGFLEKRQGQATRVCAPTTAGSLGKIAWLDLDRITNQLYFEVFKEVSSYALERGYSVDYISLQNDAMLEYFFSHQSEYIGSLYSNVPDIHLPRAKMKQLYLLQNLIGIDRNSVMLSDSYVLTDNAAGETMAVEYLLSTGHRHILYFGSAAAARNIYPPFATRQMAFRETLLQHDIPFDPRYEFFMIPNDIYADVPRTLKQILDNQPVDAIITNSDSWAITTLYALRSLGYTVPDDISLIGFDGNWESGQTIPPLTTVRQPVENIGRQAVDLLIKRAKSKRFDTEQILVKPELLIRNSVATRQ